MTFYRVVLASCCLLACITANAQVQINPQQQTEQVETGFTSFPGRPNTPYQIRLLPISSFPQLPAPVAQEISRRGCMIPQTYAARRPENVIHGSFEKKGSDDWALLCSANRSTTLYVFFQSDFANPIALRHQPDNEWLGMEWSLDYGSAWGIAARPATFIQPRDSADHDGVDDAFIEKSIIVHYFHDGRWTTIDGGQ